MEDTLNAGAFIMGEDPLHPETVIGYGIPSDEHLIAIGKVAVAFTNLEEMVSTCFSLLLGCEPELASILANSLAIKERCDTLSHIFAYRFGSAEMIRSGKNVKREKNLQRLSRLFKRITDAAEIRNRILHSTWSPDTQDERKAHQLKWSRTRAKPGFPSSDYSVLSADEISKQAASIDDVRDELYMFFWEHFGPWITERAKNKEGGLEFLEP
jgi:hypothetical protein